MAGSGLLLRDDKVDFIGEAFLAADLPDNADDRGHKPRKAEIGQWDQRHDSIDPRKVKVQQTASDCSLDGLIEANDDRHPNGALPDAVIRDKLLKAAEDREHNAHRENKNEERAGNLENVADAGRRNKEDDGR